MPTIEQKICTLENTNSLLVDAVNRLTSEVTGKIGEINSRIAAKEALVDNFIAEAQPEHRYVQDIYIGGSTDYFYPVWWGRFPPDSEVIGKLAITRDYYWNGDAGERPLNPDSNHQAGLLFEIEGNGAASSGYATFSEIKRYSTRYSDTLSHYSFRMYTTAEPIDSDKPMHPAAEDGSFGPKCHTPGIYVRGGGLTYRITSNWIVNISYNNGDSMEKQKVARSQNTYWYAEPIHISKKLPPAQTLNAYVDPA